MKEAFSVFVFGVSVCFRQALFLFHVEQRLNKSYQRGIIKGEPTGLLSSLKVLTMRVNSQYSITASERIRKFRSIGGAKKEHAFYPPDFSVLQRRHRPGC